MEVVRSVFMAIDLFPNVDDLVNFVEEAINSDPNEIPDTLSDTKSKHRAFLKLPFKKIPFDDIYYGAAFAIYKTLLKIPKINMMFQAKHYQRFLMHLVCYHTIISGVYWIRFQPSRDLTLTRYFGLTRRYFKLSCTPNVMSNFLNGTIRFITVRPVKREELLTATWFNPLLEPKEARQLRMENFGYICKCARCDRVFVCDQNRRSN